MKYTASAPRRRPLPLRLWGFALFIFYFFRALLLANIDLAKVVLTEKRKRIVPGFISYQVDHLSKLEILVLSHCITLTPGSATIEIAPDFSYLTLHVLDTLTSDALVKSIQNDLEAPILKWSR